MNSLMATKSCSLANNNIKLYQVLSKNLFKSYSNDILKISRNLSSSKTHGHNMTSIWISNCNHDHNVWELFNTSKTKSDY